MPPKPIPLPRRGVHRPAWRRVAAAAALCAALAGTDAWALALGRVTVQSQLGQPLRAEIDLPALTDAEAATLQLELAGPERYRSASLEYAPWLRDVTLTRQRRPDGRAVIEVRSERIVTEPFVDLVVVARWAGGELLRGYTLLFDPPNLRPVAPVMPSVGPAPGAAAAAPPPPAQPPAARVEAGGPPPQAPAVAAARAGAQRIVVRPGDTAGRLARQYRPEGVTLEQMLVALLRANPQAFIRGNVHWLKAGAVIDLPDAASAGQVDPQEARTLLNAQTRDFNEYRRRLAAAAPPQRAPEGQRQAQGKVESAVTDAAPQASAQDKLTLSKAGDGDAQTQQLAEQRQQQEQQQRAAELERNLRELEQLRQQAATPPAPAPAEAAPAAPPAPAQPAAAPAAEPPAAPSPAPAVPAAPPGPAQPAAEAQGPVQAVLQHPWTLPGAAVVIVLLGALAAVRARRRRSAAAVPAVAEPANAAEPAPAAEQAPEAPGMPSASDTDTPLDPVAEAEVYLSYGRDAQAEDLLRETLAAEPHRLDARLKLLEILARRQDAAGFEAEARALQPLCTEDSPEWQRTCELGHTLDPDHPLYQRSVPTSGAAAGAAAGLAAAAAAAQAADAQPPTLDLALDTVDATAQPGDSALEVDLELTSQLPPVDEVKVAEAPTPAEDDLGLDFDFEAAPAVTEPTAGAEPPASTAEPSAATLPPEVAGLSLDLPVDESVQAAEAPPLPEVPAVEAPAEPMQATEPSADQNPLETKLSLAREFEAIGDVDGARILAEEVAAEAQGELRERARAFLAQLG